MIDSVDLELILAVQNGLPLVSRPYAQIAQQLQLTETLVIQRLLALKKRGLIKRLGVIVNHRQLGYQSNAMVVFNIPDTEVTQIGRKISQFDFINLCYRRPRHEDVWPFNLFCMIHGKTQETVLQQLKNLIQACALEAYEHDILFSQRCFKQRGARYKSTPLKS